MIAVLQRVSGAKVSAQDGTFEPREIKRGFVILLGVAAGDMEDDAGYLAGKIAALRIFPNADGKFDKTITEAGGEIIVVSQFTLMGDCRGGRRPDFTCAAPAEKAKPLYEKFISLLKEGGLTVKNGEFGAMMTVEIKNDGPVTLIIDTKEKR